MKIPRIFKPYRMNYNRSPKAYFCDKLVVNTVTHVLKKLGYNIVDISVSIGGRQVSCYDEYDDEVYYEIEDSIVVVKVDKKVNYNNRHVDKLLSTLEFKLKNKYGFQLIINDLQLIINDN